MLDEYDYHFELGKAAELRTGRDVVLISTGLMTMRALAAADRGSRPTMSTWRSLHVPTIKPARHARRSCGPRDTDRLIVTMENHTIDGRSRRVRRRHAGLRRKAGRRIAPIAPA